MANDGTLRIVVIGDTDQFQDKMAKAGNVLGKGYLAGIGMTIGTVFGRIAGASAAAAIGPAPAAVAAVGTTAQADAIRA